MKIRPVNILMSKKIRVVVTCQQCPISPNRLELHQKTACMNFEPKIDNGKKTLVRRQVCDYYRIGSIRRVERELFVVDCNFE